MNLVERMAAVRAGKTPPTDGADEGQAAPEPAEPLVARWPNRLHRPPPN